MNTQAKPYHKRAVYINYGAEDWYADSQGHIERPGRVQGSASWRILGAVERNNFGCIVRRYTLAQVLDQASSIPWRHKNGKQRTFIQDYDNGALREWRSPRHTLRKGPF